MSSHMQLRALPEYVRALLSCDGVRLLLGCGDPLLCHPLVVGIASDEPLLKCEQMRALCDIALQTESAWKIDELEGDCEGSIKSILLIALVRPRGVLGLLLCTSSQRSAFTAGDVFVLEQYAPEVCRQVEGVLEQAETSRRLGSLATTIPCQDQGEFISMVGHELRMPLTAIKGYAGLLQAYGPAHVAEDGTPAMTPARQQRYLDLIMEQTNHLEVLLGDLLDISRIQAGRLSLSHTWVDLALLCERVAQLVQYRFEQQPARYVLRYRCEPTLPLVWADPVRVQQILMNLLENAMKYSPAGGLIELIAFSQASPNELAEMSDLLPARDAEASAMAYVLVRDQGIGIPDQLQPSLFRPFARLEHPATRTVTGTGLGLYISRKLVEAMDGQVVLHSCEGEGTSILFSLPAAQVSASTSLLFSAS